MIISKKELKFLSPIHKLLTLPLDKKIYLDERSNH
jgi:hypothetical protein